MQFQKEQNQGSVIKLKQKLNRVNKRDKIKDEHIREIERTLLYYSYLFFRNVYNTISQGPCMQDLIHHKQNTKSYRLQS